MKFLGFSALILAWLVSDPIPGLAQGKLKSFEDAAKVLDVRFEPSSAKPGQTVTLKITLEPIRGAWTYPTIQPEQESNPTNRILFPESGDVIFVGPFVDPPGAKSKEEPVVLKAKNLLYYPESVTWERKAVVSPKATPGEKTIVLRNEEQKSRLQICNDVNCVFSRDAISAKLTVVAGSVEVEPAFQKEVQKVLGAVGNPVAPPVAPRTTPVAAPSKILSGETHKVGAKLPTGVNIKEELDKVQIPAETPTLQTTKKGLIPFLLTAMFWGIVTLLTPCVFPMVPITVSYFLKQGEKKIASPVMLASVYTLTIVVVLGLSAVTLLSTFQALAVNPYMNVILGLLFIFFALSLFGMFDIILPNFLVNFSSSREGQGGYVGTVFMALSFTIVSFTCVAPFLGGFSGMAAAGNFSLFELALGGLAFSTSFALPFFMLALFPSLLKKLPRNGTWMNTIKVIMGFLEVAAALKFFRNAELRWLSPPTLFTFDFVLAMYVVILVLMGLYLLGLYRLPHDHGEPEPISVPRFLMGFVAISIGIYLAPGMLSTGHKEKQRPAGVVFSWVESFLLPDEVDDFPWSADLPRALAEARKDNGYVFIDFTGTNCKLNEKTVFTKPDVRAALLKYRLVQLFTDTVPPQFYETPPSLGQRDDDAQAILDFQKKSFGTVQLPLYVILKPEADGKNTVVGIYDEGKINDEAAFLRFLQGPLQ